MPVSFSLTLNWEGPEVDPAKITGRAGIYMVIAGKKNTEGKWDPDTYKLLDIGQSGDAAARLAAHDREDCWKRNTPSEYALLFKFAAMPSRDYEETHRRIAECCLRAHNRRLPCGTECNDGYNVEDSVSVTNTGKLLPLGKEYACP
jgi:hypothetical protein